MKKKMNYTLFLRYYHSYRNIDVYDDFSIMEESGQQLAVLPILFFLGTLPLSLALGGVAWAFVLFFGNSAHFVVTK